MTRPQKAPKKFVRQLAEEFYGEYGESARSWEFIDDLFRLEEGDLFEDHRTGRSYRVDPDDLMDALEALPRKSRLAKILREEGLIREAAESRDQWAVEGGGPIKINKFKYFKWLRGLRDGRVLGKSDFDAIVRAKKPLPFNLLHEVSATELGDVSLRDLGATGRVFRQRAPIDPNRVDPKPRKRVDLDALFDKIKEKIFRILVTQTEGTDQFFSSWLYGQDLSDYDSAEDLFRGYESWLGQIAGDASMGYELRDFLDNAGLRKLVERYGRVVESANYNSWRAPLDLHHWLNGYSDFLADAYNTGAIEEWRKSVKRRNMPFEALEWKYPKIKGLPRNERRNLSTLAKTPGMWSQAVFLAESF
jgi:hypothetical protein